MNRKRFLNKRIVPMQSDRPGWIIFYSITFLTFSASIPRTCRSRRFGLVILQSLRSSECNAVQYISEPEFPWDRLREEKNGIYEKGIDPPPAAVEWFHARIVVDDSTINVYVNNSATPSLTVKKLNNRKNGLIGLWSDGVNGEFANMVIKK